MSSCGTSPAKPRPDRASLHSVAGKIAEPHIDAVNHPTHYNQGRIEVIDAIEDWQLGFHLGNVVKYVARAKHKGNELQDLEKAAWYLQRRIKQLKANEAFTTGIENCSACGERHSDVEFHKLAFRDGCYTHKGRCPKSGIGIYLTLEEGEK